MLCTLKVHLLNMSYSVNMYKQLKKGITMKKLLIILSAILILIGIHGTGKTKAYKLKIDKFNNQKTYIGKVFAKAGTTMGARMFGGNNGRIWATKIVVGDDFEDEGNKELLEKLELENFESGFYALAGKYYTGRINSIDRKDSLVIKINKDFYKYDLMYYDNKAEIALSYGGWVCEFGYMVPLSILEKIIDPDNKVMIRVKGNEKDLTININSKKTKKLASFLKSVKELN